MVSKKPQIQEESELSIISLSGGGFNPDRIRFLVYGESGAGKTRFASTWPKPLFIDIDDGLASVTEPVDSIPITEWDQIPTVYEFLAEGEHPYQTIIVDSLNEAQVMALDATVAAFPNIRRPYDSLAAQSDYGKMLKDFDDLIRQFKSLPYHLVLIAQVEDKQFDTDAIKPQLIGRNTSANICRMMDIVGFLYRDGQTPMLSFDLNEYVCKDRSGTLPAVIEKPSYTKLSKFWKSRSK